MEPTCPYHGLPDHAVWKRTLGRRPIETIFPLDPQAEPLASGSRVMVAGSCFAQRIGGQLGGLGLELVNTEPGPDFLLDEERRRMGYGVYSARYGNIYSSLQLQQLVARAYGSFEPVEPVWRKGDRWVDPFRPGIDLAGFVSESECLEDRARHLAAVREAIETAEVFVFTLGLTEAWCDRRDGAVFPVCPGCGHGGTFDEATYAHHRFSVADVVGHMDAFLRQARRHNPRLRVILTVSPVPLIATFSGEHVLTATTASKAVLRAACDEVRALHDGVDYFPSYEIVQTGGPDWAFEADRRAVRPQAVAHIIDCFAAQYGLRAVQPRAVEIARPGDDRTASSFDVACDEDEIIAAMARARAGS